MLTRMPLRLMLLGIIALYIGERAFDGIARAVISGAAALLIGGALLTAILRFLSSRDERRTAYGWVVIEYVICTVALLLYAARLPAFSMIDLSADTNTIFAVVWPGLLLLGLVPAITMELSIGGMLLTPHIELWRVRLAARAARIVALAIVGFAGLNYTASKWNEKVDLSYFKTAEPGSSTLALVKNLTVPVQATLFFPPGNEVEEEAYGYLEVLSKTNPQFTVERLDQARVPELAKKMKVRSNGYLALKSGEKMETIRLDTELESARGKLRDFDAEIQEKLIEVVRPPRVAYITYGHLERSYGYSEVQDNKRRGLNEFRDLLKRLGFEVKQLGLAEGLGNRVPDDATVVIISGPLEPFLPAEQLAIMRYLMRGGRLLAAFDPEHGHTGDEIMQPLGFRISKALVANSRYTIRIKNRGESPYDLITNQVSRHYATTTLSTAGNRMGLLMLGAGAISRITNGNTSLKHSFVVSAMDQSWLDEDGDRVHDKPDEKSDGLSLALVLEGQFKPLDRASKAAEEASKAEHGTDPEAHGSEHDHGEEAGHKADHEAHGSEHDHGGHDHGGHDHGKEGHTANGADDEAADDEAVDDEAVDDEAKQRTARAVVLADADLMSTGPILATGNSYFLADCMRWLADDEETAGKVESERDIPIVHRKDEDRAWFYGTSFLFPTVILVGGLLFTTRGGRRRRRG